MKAVVLVGGEGTRLRPLTETTPKPLLPLVDRPILDHVLDHLVAHGVREVIMSSPYLEATFHPFIRSRDGVPSITWVTERKPLGTGGAIVSVLDLLGDEPFFALNGDILTDLDLRGLRTSHDTRSAAVTIALHEVDDARAFGLVERERDGRVTAFREKPRDSVPGAINAGTYLLDPAALRSWNPHTTISIETEIFPALIGRDLPVFGFGGDAYWLDLGTPEQYLRAHIDLLAGKVSGRVYDAPWIGPGASIHPEARLGTWVVVGEGGEIGGGAGLDEAVLLPDAVVGEDVVIERSIVGPGAVIGGGARLLDAVVGGGVRIAAGERLEGERRPAG
ncbi:MAG TPA: NDP-sugar synthase [Actinomycetota bacterium]|nr:NDP-sugar synthase [Actinomycetota bacterium]